MRYLTGHWLCSLLLALPLTLVGCQQEGPAQQTGGETDSATRLNPVEQAGESITGTAATAIDRAQQTEDILGQAAQRTADQINQTTP